MDVEDFFEFEGAFQDDEVVPAQAQVDAVVLSAKCFAHAWILGSRARIFWMA